MKMPDVGTRHALIPYTPIKCLPLSGAAVRRTKDTVPSLPLWSLCSSEGNTVDCA
jgi:hypothetical protein